MSLTRLLAFGSVLFGASLACAPVVCSDVIRLRTGETIKGRATEKTNEQFLVVEDYLSGTVREISWDAIEDADALELKPRFNIPIGVNTLIPCTIIEYRLDDGAVSRLSGVIENEDADAKGFVHVRIRAQKEPVKVAKIRIVSREASECEAGDVYPPEELAQKYRDEMNPQDARGWLLFAQKCEQVGAYDAAKEGYDSAAADETFLNRKLAQDGAARCEALIRDKEALDEIGRLRMSMSGEQWNTVGEGIDGFATKHPTASEPIKKRLETLKSEFDVRRKKASSAKVAKRFPAIVKDAIRKRVASKETEFGTLQGWIRKEAIDDSFEAVSRELLKHDKAVTLDEVKTFWEQRVKKGWYRARYGNGSRFIEQPKILPKTGSKGTSTQKSNKQQGPAPVLKLPEPVSKDDWWKDLSTDQRQEFWWAEFVVKSGLFEVDAKQERSPCSVCNGNGTIDYQMSNGQTLTALCPRCGGLRYDITVKYR